MLREGVTGHRIKLRNGDLRHLYCSQNTVKAFGWGRVCCTYRKEDVLMAKKETAYFE